MSIPVHSGTLEARRERAVQRAITRACQQPTDARLAMIDRLQGLPEAYYEIQPDAVRSAPHDYVVDGVHTPRWVEAVELLRDRYGLTAGEAECALDGARSGGPWGEISTHAAPAEAADAQLAHLDAVHGQVADSVRTMRGGGSAADIAELSRPFEEAWAEASPEARKAWRERAEIGGAR